MQQNEKFNLIDFVIKAAMNIAPPFIVGIMAKIANDITGGKKRSMMSWIAIFFMCVSAVFLSDWICQSYSLNKTTTLIINTFSTLFSEQLFKIIFANGIPFIQEMVKDNLKFTLRAIDKKGDEKSDEKKKD